MTLDKAREVMDCLSDGGITIASCRRCEWYEWGHDAEKAEEHSEECPHYAAELILAELARVEAARAQDGEEIDGLLDTIPDRFRVAVREGGGSEACFASMAVSLFKMRDAIQAAESSRDLLAARVSVLEALIERFGQWDMLSACDDGPYWRGEIEAALRERQGEVNGT